MGKRVLLAIVLCSLPALAQVGGKWKRITNYSNETGDKHTAVSVSSLSTVPSGGIERTAVLVIAATEGKPMLAIDFGGVWVIDARESVSWFDDERDKPVNVTWNPRETRCGESPCTTLITCRKGWYEEWRR